MVLPLGPMGGGNLSLATGPPPRGVMKLRPFLQLAILGCAVALFGKFVGHQQQTALSDLFPVIAGFVILYSQSNFYACIMVFVVLSALAFVFSIYYLCDELVSDTKGGRHFFARSCQKSFEIDLARMEEQKIKVCDNDLSLTTPEYGSCALPYVCTYGNESSSFASPIIEAASTVSHLYLWEDGCSPYTIIGHASMVMSVFFNGLSTYIGWKMCNASRLASQALMADQGGTEMDGQLLMGGRQMSPAQNANQFHAFQGSGQTLGG